MASLCRDIIGRAERWLLAHGAADYTAAAELAGDGIATRIVSMPCVEAFERQDAAWREAQVPLPWQAQFDDLRYTSGTAWYKRTFTVDAQPTGAAVLHYHADPPQLTQGRLYRVALPLGVLPVVQRVRFKLVCGFRAVANDTVAK